VNLKKNIIFRTLADFWFQTGDKHFPAIRKITHELMLISVGVGDVSGVVLRNQ
jgi:cytochrome bd-type quinol oxidase subunit 1